MAEREVADVADVNQSFTTSTKVIEGTMRDMRDDLAAEEVAAEARYRAQGVKNPHIKASLDAILG